MPLHVEIYAAGGIAIGIVARAGHLRSVLDTGGSVVLEGATWHHLDGTASRLAGDVTIRADDVHVATADEAEDLPVHAQWHDIVVEVGPYRVAGQMPTMPGFAPGRPLARPSGEFVQLRDVSIGLLTEPHQTGITRPMALVNRYVVDRVEADLMLGFFFPGAEMASGGRRTEQPAGAGATVMHAAPRATTP